MNLATMRSEFSKRVAGLDSALTSTDVDAYLNRAFRYTIPDKVHGMLSDGTWTFDTVASTVEYELPANVHTPRKPVYVDGEPIETYTRREQFWWDYDADTTDTAEPRAALIYGGGDQTYARHLIRFYPIPDAAYTITGGGRLYPAEDMTAATDLNPTHALAIVASAAQEFALDLSVDEIAQREGVRFLDKLSDLRTRSNGPARERRRRRTY